MLVAETAEEYRFVTQPAHAALAGRLAETWVREDGAVTTPEVVMATDNHDNGWWLYDRRPHLTEDGTPAGVGDAPAETWVEFYESGIDSVVELDPYAGLLASMHGSGLRRERYGLTDGPPSDHPAYDAFVDREERRQRELAAELEGRLSEADERALATLHETGTVDDTESRLWREFRLLETWDICSIALCTATAGTTTEIPTAPSADIVVDALDPTTVTVEPYPFDTTPLTVQVPTRTVEKGSFDTETALCREYYRTAANYRSITLRPD